MTYALVRKIGSIIDHDELSEEKVALIENIYSQLKHKSGCQVIDTVFAYHPGVSYDWLTDFNDEQSKTKAQVLFLPVNDEKEVKLWMKDILNSIEKIGRCDELTASIQTQVRDNKETGISFLLTFRAHGIFNIYDMAFHKNHLCAISGLSNQQPRTYGNMEKDYPFLRDAPSPMALEPLTKEKISPFY